MSLRKKRNFKALQLPSAPIDGPDSAGSMRSIGGSPIATRVAPRRRDIPEPESSRAGSKSALHATLTSTLANLDLKADSKRWDLKNEDLRNLQELGSGNGGSVVKVLHIPTGTIMAKKIVLIDAKPSVRKQILRELQIMHACHSPYIIASYGSYLAEPNICICMEFMDKGSFDRIYKKHGPVPIDVVGTVALAVLEGLRYLYDVHRIIHRDIKPSNILCNSSGEIKLCDFGVSGELENSVANTFVGTSTYMSPERIQGADYSVKSDVWSLGITLIELAHGCFPFSDADADSEATKGDAGVGASHLRRTSRADRPRSTIDRRKSKGVSLHGGGAMLSILELMQVIVQEPPPELDPRRHFPPEAHVFVDACLEKDVETRRPPKELLEFGWIKMVREHPVDMRKWASGL
ncbi:kinase [Fistulina hepatica ATCC 64428]|uniref:Kinase n=1 Tax=Fistulina hepatica ATCC 64428 TaxID=1128425 RepID=A0A0D7APQ8_9AGAR|nr:kinase [Fistulina hepatica ATCC 64428]